MSNQEINEINSLPVLDYDIFGKCNDMMNFINNTQNLKRDDQQIKQKIGAVGKLINALLKFLKQQDSSSLQDQPDYYDIVYLINNNLSQKIKQYEDKIKQMNIIDQQSKAEINQLKQEIQRYDIDQRKNVKQIEELHQKIKAQKKQLDLLEVLESEQIQDIQYQYDNLDQRYQQSTNQIKELQFELKQKQDKIQEQEGKLNQLQQQIKKLQTDQSQDRKDPIFYKYQQILQRNQELQEINKQLCILNPIFQQNNQEKVDENLQNQNVQDEKLNQEIKEIQKNILYKLNELQVASLFLSIFVGVYLIKLYQE
ncbi:unnamed protein product [Paramecium pentaurelia]|uniref:Uncharacterized protein n=1 Tax=Paramecium pentaurelia TaxID=43138 RepID=A0A8S1UFD9_9CILI|nr:unnamed protein product [Paramecium pentaurelia]